MYHDITLVKIIRPKKYYHFYLKQMTAAVMYVTYAVVKRKPEKIGVKLTLV